MFFDSTNSLLCDTKKVNLYNIKNRIFFCIIQLFIWRKMRSWNLKYKKRYMLYFFKKRIIYIIQIEGDKFNMIIKRVKISAFRCEKDKYWCLNKMF